MNRSVALLVWSSTLVVPLFFGAVAEAVRGNAPHLPANGLLFWLSLATSAACITLSQLLPRRLPAVPAGREATAFIRLVVAWALCEGAAPLPAGGLDRHRRCAPARASAPSTCWRWCCSTRAGTAGSSCSPASPSP